MKISRYTERAGGITDGGIGRNQHADAGARELGPERRGERSGFGRGDDAGGVGEERKERLRERGFDGHDERQLDGGIGSRSVDDARCAFGQGGTVADGDRERQLQRLVGGCGGQDCGQPAEVEEGRFPVAGATLARLLAEATEALAHLDAPELEELGRRGEAMAALDLGSAGVVGEASVPVLEHRFRLFAALLKATGENLATLRRAQSQDSRGASTFGDASFGGRAFGNGEGLPLNGYVGSRNSAPRGLFESFGLYSEEDAAESIWPRGRVAQARARGQSSTPKPQGGSGLGRA